MGAMRGSLGSRLTNDIADTFTLALLDFQADLSPQTTADFKREMDELAEEMCGRRVQCRAAGGSQ